LQDCLNKKGYCITVADNTGERIVIVKDKNSKIVEAILLTEWNNDKKKYEEKYGEIRHTLIKLAPIVKEGKPLKLAPITRDNNDKEVQITKDDGVKAERVQKNQEEYTLWTRDKAGRRVPVIRGKKDNQKDIARADNEVAIIEKVAVATKPTPSVRLVADKVVMVDEKATAAKVKDQELTVVRIKLNPKTAISAKTAAEAKPRVIIKAQKVEPVVEPKPAQGPPMQDK
ncbi:MAG TPA: hypothetical protein VGE79_06700, partial [Niastella sp.]